MNDSRMEVMGGHGAASLVLFFSVSVLLLRLLLPSNVSPARFFLPPPVFHAEPGGTAVRVIAQVCIVM
jgi:hypothetical protein